MASTEYFIGRRSVFSYAVEDSSYGTANTATTHAWPGFVQKWTDSDSQTLEPLNPMDTTDSATVGQYYPMVPSFGGTMEMLVQHMRLPMLCMHMTDSPGQDIGYAFLDDGGAFTDDTTDFNDSTAADCPLMPATEVQEDAFYYGDDAKFDGVVFNFGTVGVGTAITWEYYDGDSWETLSATDGTSGLTASGELVFDAPADWAATEINSQEAYWIRSRVSTASFTTIPVLTQGQMRVTPYVHTLAASNTMQSLSIQVGHHHGTTDFTRDYKGVMCKKGDFVFTKGDWMRFNADFVSQVAVKNTTVRAYQASVDSLKKYTATNIRPYKSSDLTLTLGGNDISAYVTQARLGFDNQLQVDEAMDASVGELIAQPSPQVQLWDAGVTMKTSASTMWDLFKAGSELSSTNTFVVTNGNYSITWTLSGVMVEKVSPPVDITQGVVIQDIGLKIASVAIAEITPIETDYDTVCA